MSIYHLQSKHSSDQTVQKVSGKLKLKLLHFRCLYLWFVVSSLFVHQ